MYYLHFWICKVSEWMRNLHVFCEFHSVFYSINYKKCVLNMSKESCIPDLKTLKKKKILCLQAKLINKGEKNPLCVKLQIWLNLQLFWNKNSKAHSLLIHNSILYLNLSEQFEALNFLKCCNKDLYETSFLYSFSPGHNNKNINRLRYFAEK